MIIWILNTNWRHFSVSFWFYNQLEYISSTKCLHSWANFTFNKGIYSGLGIECHAFFCHLVVRSTAIPKLWREYSTTRWQKRKGFCLLGALDILSFSLAPDRDQHYTSTVRRCSQLNVKSSVLCVLHRRVVAANCVSSQ